MAERAAGHFATALRAAVDVAIRVRNLRRVLSEEVHFIEAADGQRLALTEVRHAERRPKAGSPAFLLVHGFAQNRKGYMLGPMPEALLDRGARVFLGELRGHGDSLVHRAHSWNLETHLELDCPALIDGARGLARVERLHWIGHSMGGLLGCALLAKAPPLHSLTALATPLVLGAARPLVRVASLLLGPLATIAPKPRRVPMHALLAALSGPLSSAEAGGALRLLQRVTRLANPEAASPEALREILATADPESPAVMEELARNAVRLEPKLAGVNLVEAVKTAPIPLAAVVGTSDIFAPRAAIAPMEAADQAGPRRIVELPGGTHVDSIMGHHVPETIDALWDFLIQGNGVAPAETAPQRAQRTRSTPPSSG